MSASCKTLLPGLHSALTRTFWKLQTQLKSIQKNWKRDSQVDHILTISYRELFALRHLRNFGVHFIRYTLLVPGRTPFCLQNCLNPSWHGNKVLETFLREFGPYWYDSITQLLQICRLHTHDANLLFHHIPKVLYWIEIWWLWRPFEYSELIVMFKKPVWDDSSFIYFGSSHQKMGTLWS